MNLIAHVEIPATDLQRAMAFYAAVFGVSFGDVVEIHGNQMAYFPFDENVNGASGALAQGEVYVPSLNGPIIYLHVSDIDQVIEKATALGGSLLFPKTPATDSIFVAEIQDSEGNRIALQSG